MNVAHNGDGRRDIEHIRFESQDLCHLREDPNTGFVGYPAFLPEFPRSSSECDCTQAFKVASRLQSSATANPQGSRELRQIQARFCTASPASLAARRTQGSHLKCSSNSRYSGLAAPRGYTSSTCKTWVRNSFSGAQASSNNDSRRKATGLASNARRNTMQTSQRSWFANEARPDIRRRSGARGRQTNGEVP